jgi:hypothetical protein
MGTLPPISGRRRPDRRLKKAPQARVVAANCALMALEVVLMMQKRKSKVRGKTDEKKAAMDIYTRHLQ